MFSHREFLLKFFMLSGISILYLILLLQGPMMAPDSPGYLTLASLRPPVYPLFIQFSKFIVGPNYYLHAIVFFQLSLGFSVSLLFVNTLQRQLHIGGGLKLLLLCLVLSPYYGYVPIGNFILSEGLAYPLFLFICHFLFASLHHSSLKYVLLFLGFTAAAILVRSQFLFILPIAVILTLHFLVFKKAIFSKASRIILIGGLIGTIIAPPMVERTYNMYVRGTPITNPTAELQLLVPLLYVAQQKDEHSFREPLQATIFKDIIRQMRARKFSYVDYPKIKPPFLTPYAHYATCYNAIYWEILWPTFIKHGVKETRKVDHTALEMVRILIKSNFKDYIFMYIRIFFAPYGWYLTAFVILLFLISFRAYLSTREEIPLITFFVLAASISNIAHVALVEPTLPRYTIYTDVLLASWLLILTMRSLNLILAPSKSIRE